MKMMGRRSAWRWLLILPFAGLLYPPFYARAEPSLFGFPFFYWYQFGWIVAGAIVTAIVARLEG